MSCSLSKNLSKYFPKESVLELDKYLRGNNFRLHVIDWKNDLDLTSIFSERSFKTFDYNGVLCESLEDLEFEVFHGNLIPGVQVRHKQLTLKEGEYRIIEKQSINPCVGRANLLLLKKSKRSDFSKGYFDYHFINVYAIVS